MLTISNTLAAALASDSVEKQLVISFPFESRGDITNAHLVDESLQFQESICSADTLKFGLAEASRLEFECFDEADCTGSTIDAKIGVDNEYVPLGRFIVDECQRDYTGARLMKVTAYSAAEQSTIGELSQWEQLQHDYGVFKNTPFVRDAARLILGNTKGNGFDVALPEMLESLGSAKVFPSVLSVTYTDNGSKIYVTPEYRYVDQPHSLTLNRLYRMDYSDLTLDAVYAAIDSASLSIDKTLLKAKVAEIFDTVVRATLQISEYLKGSSGNRRFSGKYAHQSPEYKYCYVYPSYDPTDTVTQDCTVWILAPSGFRVQIGNGSPTTIIDTTPKIYRVDTSSLPSVPVTYQRTAIKNAAGVTLYACLENESLSSIVQDYAELQGKFSRPKRDGSFGFQVLDSTPVASLSKSDIHEKSFKYQSEANTIGKVCASWTDDNNVEQYAEYVIAPKGYVYDMSGNALLAGRSTSEVIGYLQSFATNAQLSEYIPLEATVRGYPHLEAGDCVTIGGKKTFILERRMEGINSLADQICANGTDKIIDTGLKPTTVLFADGALADGYSLALTQIATGSTISLENDQIKIVTAKKNSDQSATKGYITPAIDVTNVSYVTVKWSGYGRQCGLGLTQSTAIDAASVLATNFTPGVLADESQTSATAITNAVSMLDVQNLVGSFYVAGFTFGNTNGNYAGTITIDEISYQ